MTCIVYYSLALRVSTEEAVDLDLETQMDFDYDSEENELARRLSHRDYSDNEYEPIEEGIEGIRDIGKWFFSSCIWGVH